MCSVYKTAEEGSNLFGQDNSNYPILETYAEGSVMEVKVVVSTNHWVSLALNHWCVLHNHHMGMGTREEKQKAPRQF